jgi:hypothetical protein
MESINILGIDKTIKIIDLDSSENDFKFWQTQTIEKRLETLEQLRIQYIIWKYGTEQGFQRVYRVIELS